MIPVVGSWLLGAWHRVLLASSDPEERHEQILACVEISLYLPFSEKCFKQNHYLVLCRQDDLGHRVF